MLSPNPVGQRNNGAAEAEAAAERKPSCFPAFGSMAELESYVRGQASSATAIGLGDAGPKRVAAGLGGRRRCCTGCLLRAASLPRDPWSMRMGAMAPSLPCRWV